MTLVATTVYPSTNAWCSPLIQNLCSPPFHAFAAPRLPSTFGEAKAICWKERKKTNESFCLKTFTMAEDPKAHAVGEKTSQRLGSAAGCGCGCCCWCCFRFCLRFWCWDDVSFGSHASNECCRAAEADDSPEGQIMKLPGAKAAN